MNSKTCDVCLSIWRVLKTVTKYWWTSGTRIFNYPAVVIWIVKSVFKCMDRPTIFRENHAIDSEDGTDVTSAHGSNWIRRNGQSYVKIICLRFRSHFLRMKSALKQIVRCSPLCEVYQIATRLCQSTLCLCNARCVESKYLFISLLFSRSTLKVTSHDDSTWVITVPSTQPVLIRLVWHSRENKRVAIRRFPCVFLFLKSFDPRTVSASFRYKEADLSHRLLVILTRKSIELNITLLIMWMINKSEVVQAQHHVHLSWAKSWLC